MSNPSSQKVPTRFQVSINWKVCVFSAFFLPFLVSLGFWQLQRAEEKRTIQQLILEQQALPPQSIANIRSDIEAGGRVLYRRAQTQGTFDQNRYWLIENRTHKGQNGYHVVAPLYTNTKDAVLVNLGWVKGGGYRSELPVVDIPSSVVSISGQIVKPSVNSLLAGEVKSTGAWPRVTLQIDIESMEQELKTPLFPLVLQIDAENPSALQVYWAAVNVPVSKHLGYAYQWFAMALALLVLTVFANTNLGLLLKRA